MRTTKYSSIHFCVKRYFAVKELPWCTPKGGNQRPVNEAKKVVNMNNSKSKLNERNHDELSPPKNFGIIAAVTRNRVLGINNHLLWGRVLSTDHCYFEKVTSEKVVILGRKTFEETKNGYLIRHVRHCVVVSDTLAKQSLVSTKRTEKNQFVSSFPEALGLAKYLALSSNATNRQQNVSENSSTQSTAAFIDCWILGGQRIYEEALRHSSAEELHLTTVDIEIGLHEKHIKEFALFPAKYRWDNKFKLEREWQGNALKSHENIDIPYHYYVYKRKRRNQNFTTKS